MLNTFLEVWRRGAIGPLFENRRDYLRAPLLVGAIVVVSLLHYYTPPNHIWLHPLLQRAYYIPILLTAVWFGWRGGITAATITSMFYVPFIVLAPDSNPEYHSTQYVEVIMFFVIATLIGFLADIEKKRRRQLEATAQKLSETYQQLQSSAEQLRRADRLSALGQLSAGLAHEIRNPLGSLKGAVQILKREELPANTRDEFATMADSEVVRLEKLVTSFLEFARPNLPQRTLLDAALLLESVAQLASETARMANVSIQVAPEPADSIAVDAEQIRQVLLNLVLNAVQAMPNGGHITLGSRQTNGCLLLTVSDEGCGIPEEVLDHIFDPFFTTRAEGTGLGLSIAYQIVNGHGGQISAQNNPGGGATFTLSLPVEPLEQENHSNEELHP